MITNTGTSTIAILPLIDSFDNACLTFLPKADPAESGFDQGAGSISWSDLTVSLVGDLAPGQAFTVDVFATDAYWNPLPSTDIVRITSSDAAASTPVSGALVDGHRQFSVSLGTVGTPLSGMSVIIDRSGPGDGAEVMPEQDRGPGRYVVDTVAEGSGRRLGGPVDFGVNLNGPQVNLGIAFSW